MFNGLIYASYSVFWAESSGVLSFSVVTRNVYVPMKSFFLMENTSSKRTHFQHPKIMQFIIFIEKNKNVTTIISCTNFKVRRV